MNGPVRMGNWGQSTVTSGAIGEAINWRESSPASVRIRIPDGILSVPGTSPNWMRWHCLPAICCFNFMWPVGRLSCQLYQRSVDVFLGLPFNIACYALLTMMVAQVCSLRPGQLIMALGDTHLYNNHVEQARQQLQREPRALPQLRIDPDITDLFAFDYQHFTLSDYDPHPHIAAPVAV